MLTMLSTPGPVDTSTFKAKTYSAEPLKAELDAKGAFSLTDSLAPVPVAEIEASNYTSNDLGKKDLSSYE
jgi:hypothetical protein